MAASLRDRNKVPYPIEDMTVATPEQEQQQASPADAQVPAGLTQAGAARRRFTRAGAAATGVLLTLKSQPGMAVSVCVTPSGYQSSLTGSPHQSAANTCNGVSPEQYVTWYDNNQAGSWAPSDLNIVFSAVFTPAGGAQEGAKMRDLMIYSGGDQESLIMKYLCANYLNMASGRMPFLQMSMLNAIWTGWRTPSAPFRPSAGAAPWGYNEIIIYLMGTT
jgi:hypothetical protein